MGRASSLVPSSVTFLASWVQYLSKMASPLTAKYDWILALTTIAFVFSAFGNGANDVANSYASRFLHNVNLEYSA